MKRLILWARCLPLAILAIFGSTALVVTNPGYFWDDWVWIFHDSAENIQIGKELGVWWGGYLTTMINGLPSPSIAMRITALVAWIVAGGAAAAILHRHARVTRMQAFQFFVIYCATHVALIRFLTSVSLYNVYLASFWLGALIVLENRRSPLLRWVGLALLFFSFYLNSLILLYVLLVALMALGDVRPHLTMRNLALGSPGAPPMARLRTAAHSAFAQVRVPLRDFSRRNASLLALPIVFIVVKRVTAVKSALYGSYNAIEPKLLLSAIGNSFRLVHPVLRDFFATTLRTVPPAWLIVSTLVCFALFRLLPRNAKRTPWRDTLLHLALALTLFAAAIYPYMVVEKAPDLMSFYDARNILPAVAGLDFILLALINVLDRAFIHVPGLKRYGRDLLLGFVLGTSVSGGITTGIKLWHDWFWQTAIRAYLSEHRDELSADHTFVFDDQSTNSRIGDRMVWNYEYTGNLIRVFGGRDRLGVSIGEYVQWPRKVPLLTNAVLRRRFNIRDYDFRKPHVIVTIKDGATPFTPIRVMGLAYDYLRGDSEWRWDLLHRYFALSTAQEEIEADERADEMFRIASALAAYRLDHGCYPTQAGTPCQAPRHALFSSGEAQPRAIIGDIPGLFPAYMTRPAKMQWINGAADYLYFSDGVDYKLVYADASDVPYAMQAHPALVDSKNRGYGVWTSGARGW